MKKYPCIVHLTSKHSVLASSVGEAMKKAKKQFKSGQLNIVSVQASFTAGANELRDKLRKGNKKSH